jgi:transposase
VRTLYEVYTASFKAQVALDLLKEEKSLAQISAEYGVHANVLREWRAQALKGLATIFERRDDVATLKAAHTHQVDELYAEIGRLTTQVNWLKKKPPASLIEPVARWIPSLPSGSGGRSSMRRSICRLWLSARRPPGYHALYRLL